MVKGRKGKIVVASLLGVLALAILWRAFASHPAVIQSRKGAEAGTFADLEDVRPIDLDRLKRAGEVDADTEQAAANEAAAVAPPIAPPTPPPVAAVRPGEAPAGGPGLSGDGVVGTVAGGPSPPPLNVRYLGSVEARKGVWVAALLTDRKEVLTGKEGDVVANRLRIVKIGIESIDLVEVASGRQRRVRLGGS